MPTLHEVPECTSGICTIGIPENAGWSHKSVTHSSAEGSMLSVKISALVVLPCMFIYLNFFCKVTAGVRNIFAQR